MKLLGESILIDPDEVKEARESGLLVAGDVIDIWRQGTVVHVGPGRRSEYSGERIPVDVAVGDRVIHHHSSGTPVELGEDKYLLLAPRDVLAVVDPE
jgi:chaperonin GroES